MHAFYAMPLPHSRYKDMDPLIHAARPVRISFIAGRRVGAHTATQLAPVVGANPRAMVNHMDRYRTPGEVQELTLMGRPVPQVGIDPARIHYGLVLIPALPSRFIPLVTRILDAAMCGKAMVTLHREEITKAVAMTLQVNTALARIHPNPLRVSSELFVGEEMINGAPVAAFCITSIATA